LTGTRRGRKLDAGEEGTPVRVADYLAYQYSDGEKLRIRQETHRLHSEHPDDIVGFVLGHLAPEPGDLVADLGGGHGRYHPALAARGARIVDVDAFAGMTAEARRHASAAGLPVEVVLGTVDALPLRSGACDRAMANHVLYHAEDVAGALRELRRIVRPGGRVVAAANGGGTVAFMAPMEDVHAAAARAAGYTPTLPGVPFTMDDLPLVRSVFPAAEAHIVENALVFAEAEPFLRYYASGPIDRLAECPTDGSHRPRLLALVRDYVEDVIRRDGVFRVPKASGCFVARVDAEAESG
jgi:SAM-dependent methyltransferase